MKAYTYLAIFALIISIAIIAWKPKDSAIKLEIESKISSTDSLKGTTVNVQNGIVTLAGNLKNREYKIVAEKMAKRSRGVIAVVNKIKIN